MANEIEKASKRLFLHLSSLGWPDLVRKGNTIRVEREESLTIFRPIGDTYVVREVYYSEDDDEYKIPGGLSRFVLHASIPLERVFYLPRRRRHRLDQGSRVKKILGIYSGGKHESATTLDLSPNHSRRSYSNRNKTLKLPLPTLEEILKEAEAIYREGTSYGKSVERYRINQALDRHLGVKVQRTTSVTPGEFEFLVHRFNLPTKKKAGDYKKFLAEADVTALQDLCTAFIQDEVFSDKFLRRLDEFFLKEKLRNVISLGRAILDLGTEDLQTGKAHSIIDRLSDTEDEPLEIAQLENLWQHYFEKYLLYLVFTYREIYPKVGLQLEGETKYPDFIGINHYYGVDAIEIKTHLKRALTRDASHDNFSFSAELSKAIIQTTNYMDAIRQRQFVKDSDHERITTTTSEENLHRPRGIIIISRSDRLVAQQDRYDRAKVIRDFTKLRNSLEHIEVLTFDEILDMADSYAKRMVGSDGDV